MSQPRFSVVIPTHNGERYIAAAIQSVLNQVYPHFTLIILEHQSRDRTVEIVRSFEDPRVVLHSVDEALGIEANWARILDLELEPYLTILGHDDVFYPDFLAEVAACIEAEPGASLYQTHFHLINSEDEVIRTCKPVLYFETGEAFLQAHHRYQRDVFATGFVMRSADYKAVGGFPPFAKLYFADDYTFYRLAAISGKVCSAQVLFAYRYHRGSESYRSDLLVLSQASRQYYQALAETPYFEKPENIALARAYIAKTFNRRYLRLLVGLLESGDVRQLREYRQTSRDLFRELGLKRFSLYGLLRLFIEPLIFLPVRGLRVGVAQLAARMIAVWRGLRG